MTFVCTFFVLFLLGFLPPKCNTTTITLSLSSLYSVVYIFNISRVDTDQLALYLVVLEVDQSRVLVNQTLSTLLQTAQDGMIRMQIFNWESTASTLAMKVLDYASTNATALTFSEIIVESKVKAINVQYTVLLQKNNINNYILPFNLISQKYKQVFIQQSDFNLTAISYQYEPFLDTFWNQLGRDELLITWIPYFSRCQYKSSSRIFMSDIIDPWLSSDFDLQQIQKICQPQQSWAWGNSLACNNKIIQTTCILQQLNIQNTKKQPWWSDTQSTLMHFVRPGASDMTFLQASSSESELTRISQQYFKTLIPLEYTPLFDITTQTPNTFTFVFKVSTIKDLNDLQIVQALLKADYDSSLDIATGECLLTVQVDYLSNWETMEVYEKSQYTYLIFYTFITFLISIFIYVTQRFLLNNFNFWILIKLVLFPAIKGFVMAFSISMGFVMIFYYISTETDYSGISTNFDGNAVTDTWTPYAGRLGFTLFMCGYFLLGTGVNQAFKVLTPDEAKIILQDDLMEKKSQSKQFLNEQLEDEQQLEQKQQFIIRSMNSHRKYVLVNLLINPFFLLLLYYMQLHMSFGIRLVCLLIFYPIINKVLIITYRHFVIKDLMYMSTIIVSLQTVVDFIFIANQKVSETIIFYLAKLFAEYCVIPALQILFQWICVKMIRYLKNVEQQKQGQVSNFYRIANFFKGEYQSIVNECRYEKSLFYSNLMNIKIAGVLSRPYLLIITILTIEYNFICEDSNINFSVLLKQSLFLTAMCPIQYYFAFISIKFFEDKFGLEIVKCLQFNKFKFNKRKVKWVNDLFAQSKCLQYFYRQFQKFCFSSQMYMMLFLQVYAVITLFIGMKIILQVQYVSFGDPAMLVIVVIVWMMSDIMSIVLNFISIKLKFFQRKQDGKMRAKLDNVQKILKKSDYSEYLDLLAVKQYFLLHSRQWIIQNITKIFDKEDFADNNYELLIKYKHYKSLLKKKQIEQKKKLEKKIQQKQNMKAVGKQKEKKTVVKFPKKDFTQLAKPLITSWLYMAKQFAFLKSLVSNIKQQRKKQNCEFCSMNIELEVIQKNQFTQILNQYRVLNVGRQIRQQHFILFYKHRQEYITICIECKDKKLYLERKHMDLKGTPRRLIQKWLIIARSKLLHQNHHIKKNIESVY